jgi:hypothetical protein
MHMIYFHSEYASGPWRITSAEIFVIRLFPAGAGAQATGSRAAPCDKGGRYLLAIPPIDLSDFKIVRFFIDHNRGPGGSPAIRFCFDSE